MMENPADDSAPKSGRADRRRVRGETVEAALVVALAGLVLFKGLPALGGIMTGIAGMMMALTRL